MTRPKAERKADLLWELNRLIERKKFIDMKVDMIYRKLEALDLDGMEEV